MKTEIPGLFLLLLSLPVPKLSPTCMSEGSKVHSKEKIQWGRKMGKPLKVGQIGKCRFVLKRGISCKKQRVFWITPEYVTGDQIWGNVLSSLRLPNIADSQRNALATPSVSPPQCKSQTLPVTQILPSPDVAVVCEPAPVCELLQREERNRGRKMGQFTAAKGTEGTVVLNEVERKREH